MSSSGFPCVYYLQDMASRAVLCVDLGDTGTWKIVTKEKPTVPAGHVLVKMALVPVNPDDRTSPPLFLAHYGPNRVVTGTEGVGYVEEVGANVTKFKKGQRVVPNLLKRFWEDGDGSWQDYVVVPEHEAFILPDSITDEVAAQSTNLWTVYAILSDLNLSKGDYLLQEAAGSALGRQFIQLAKAWGIKTINVVRRDDVKEELKQLGADEVINSSTEDVVARVKEITGGKLADGAIDAVAGTATQAIASSVRDGQNVFVYGYLGSKDLTSTISIFDLGRVKFRFWSLFDVLDVTTPAAVIASEIYKLLEEKVLVPLSGKTFKFEDFQEAVAESAKPGRVGKVLLRF